MNQIILHVDMDAFFASVEALDQLYQTDTLHKTVEYMRKQTRR